MIRKATPDDCDQILAFWNPQIRDTLVTFNPVEKTRDELLDMIRARRDGPHGFLVAEVDGEVMGFASYAQFRGGLGYGRSMEHTIILDPRAAGRGLGRALMNALEADARDKGHHVMVAAVSGGNPEGRAFHAAIGYREVGIMPEAGFKFGRYWDLILMQKILH